MVVAAPNRTHVPLALRGGGRRAPRRGGQAAGRDVAADGQRLADAAAACGRRRERVPQPALGRRLPDAAAAVARRLARRAAPARVALRALAARGRRRDVARGRRARGGRRRAVRPRAAPDRPGARAARAGALGVRGGACGAAGRGGGRRRLRGAGARVRRALASLGDRWWRRSAGPRLRALGSRGGVRQAGARRAGGRRCARAPSPRDPGFGEEPREAWGMLGTEEQAEPVETEPGRYVAFYERLERAIRAAASRRDARRCRSRPASRRFASSRRRGELRASAPSSPL